MGNNLRLVADWLPVEPVKISLIVASFNRPSELKRLLSDVGRNQAHGHELILVLQAYDRREIALIQQDLPARMGCKILSFESGLGVFGARNAGVAAASGDIVAFLDDDCRIQRDWFEALQGAYEDGGVGGVGGYVDHDREASAPVRALYRLAGLDATRFRVRSVGFHGAPMFSMPRGSQPAEWLSGCNMSFRRTVIERVGPFPAVYGNYGFDDVDYSLRVRRAGWRLVTSEKLTVKHLPSPHGRQRREIHAYEEERRRVRLSRIHFGSEMAWKLRYYCAFARLSVAFAGVAAKRREVRSLIAAWRGMRDEMAMKEPFSEC